MEYRGRIYGKLHGKFIEISPSIPSEPSQLTQWLQSTPEGRSLYNSITIPIANQFNTHPERVTVELVVTIIEAIKKVEFKK